MGDLFKMMSISTDEGQYKSLLLLKRMIA